MSGSVLFACPQCGETDEWRASYLEAAWQTVTLIDVGGEPELLDYDGVHGYYDDGSTLDEEYRCMNCDYTIALGDHIYVPEGERVMRERDAVAILFGEGVVRASAQWRSGADIASSLASFFKLDHHKMQRHLSALEAEEGIPHTS